MGIMSCPYCDEDVEENDDCHKPDELYENECPHCERKFVYTLEYSKDYYPHKADCLNGDPHDYRERVVCPEYVGVGVYVCKNCEHREVRWAERLQKLEALNNISDWERPMVENQIKEAKRKLTEEPKP